MLMIVAFHVTYKGGFDFSGESIAVNRVWLKFWGKGESLGYIGNDIFVLLSGYFLVMSRKVKFIRVLDLWLRCVFYASVWAAIEIMCGTSGFGLRTAGRILSTRWWFISYYVVLYLVHPFFNDILHNLTRENYRKFIILLLASWSIILISNADVKRPHVIDFVCMYAAGGYIRLWAEDFGSPKHILYGIVLIAVNFVVVSVFEMDSRCLAILAAKKIYPVHYLHAMTSIFNSLAAVYMFTGFRKLGIGSIKSINTIASATMGVYLLHDHEFSAHFLWREVFRVSSFQHSVYLIPYLIFTVFAVYISCTMIDILRSKIVSMLSRGNLKQHLL